MTGEEIAVRQEHTCLLSPFMRARCRLPGTARTPGGGAPHGHPRHSPRGRHGVSSFLAMCREHACGHVIL